MTVIKKLRGVQAILTGLEGDLATKKNLATSTDERQAIEQSLRDVEEMLTLVVQRINQVEGEEPQYRAEEDEA